MTPEQLDRIISVTVTLTPSGEDIMRPLVQAGYRAGLEACRKDCQDRRLAEFKKGMALPDTWRNIFYNHESWIEEQLKETGA